MARKKPVMPKPQIRNMRMESANHFINSLSHKRRELIGETVTKLLAKETQMEFARVEILGELIGSTDIYGNNASLAWVNLYAPQTAAYIHAFPELPSQKTCYGLSLNIVSATKILFFTAPSAQDIYTVLPESLHKYLLEGMEWPVQEYMRGDFEEHLRKYPTLGTDLFSVELSTLLLG